MYDGQTLDVDPFFSTLDFIGSAIFVVDRVGRDRFRIAYLNAHYRKVSNLDMAAVTRAPIDEVFPPRIAQVLAGNYARALQQSEPYCYDELLAVDGRETWWRTTLSRAPGTARRPDRLVGAAVEVTDLKRKEIRLASEIADRTQSLSDVRTLAALSAHDLRGPLANVVSLTDIVLDGFSDLGDGKRDMIEACGDVARTSLKSLGDLMARVGEDGSDDVPPDRVDLSRLCRDLTAIADPAGRLAITSPEALVETDEVVLQVSLRNLMDNAARYTRGRIDIGLAEDRAQGTLMLTVADDGPGFSKDADPLGRALQARTDLSARGFGLGAVIRLLASRGGKLDHLRRPGPGATMQVTLPGRILNPAS